MDGDGTEGGQGLVPLGDLLGGWRENRIRRLGELGAFTIAEGMVGQQVDLLDGWQGSREVGDALEVGLGIVIAGDDRAAERELCLGFREANEVFADARVIDARKLPVLLRVGFLPIEEKALHEGQDALIVLIGCLSTGLYEDANLLRRERPCEGKGKGGLRHRLAARKRHAAARSKERPVGENARKNRLHRRSSPAYVRRAGGACRGATSTAQAARGVPASRLIAGAVRARRAPAAMHAQRGVHHALRLSPPCFRVMAPNAAQRTALEENRRADARPIVYRKGQDVRDESLFLAHFPCSHALSKLCGCAHPAAKCGAADSP